MSRPTRKTLIAFATIVPLGLLTLAPSSAFAWGRGGFGIGFGLGALAGSALSQPQPTYVERPRVYVAPAPVYVESDRHHHKNSKTADVKESKESKERKVSRVSKVSKEPVVTRAMPPPPAATPVAPAPDAREADLRKCLTKEYLPDHSVVFKDTCTQESAATIKSTPAITDTSPPRVSQSIQLEPLMAQDEVPHQMDGP
jgi:hypothetical protein